MRRPAVASRVSSSANGERIVAFCKQVVEHVPAERRVGRRRLHDVRAILVGGRRQDADEAVAARARELVDEGERDADLLGGLLDLRGDLAHEHPEGAA